VERRDFNLKIKSIDDQGTFVGLGAVYNVVDLGGDLIEPGAFTRTLGAGKKFPVLWQHDPSNPIGTCAITDTRDGIQVAGALELSDPMIARTHSPSPSSLQSASSPQEEREDVEYRRLADHRSRWSS